jgi:hypothetical protein
MLFSAGSIVSSRPTNRRHKRRANVLQQLEFWITEEPCPPASSRWEELDMEQRAALIALLARVISKVVHPQQTDEHKEKDNER